MPAFYKPVLQEILGNIPNDGSLSLEKYMPHGTSATVVQVMKHVINTICGRRLIETKQSRALGLVPEQTEPGDLICILHGCSVPVVLRKHTERNAHDDEKEHKERISELMRITDRLKKWTQSYRARKLAENEEVKQKRAEAGAKTEQTETSKASSTTLLNGDSGTSIPTTPPEATMKPTAVQDTEPEQESIHMQKTNSARHPGIGGKGRLDPASPDMPQVSSRRSWDQLQPPVLNPGAPPDHVANKYKFKMIGECYIDGMMTGEAMEKQNASVRGHNRMWTVSFELV